MRYIYLFGLFITSFSFAQKAQMGAVLIFDNPVHTVMPKMSTNVGLGIQFAYKPFHRFPMLLQLQGNIGSYSSRTMDQTYVFTNTSKTTVSVSYTSGLSKLQLGTKFYIGNEYKLVRGFITPQIGLASMRTKIVIADPQDEDDCKALERKTTQRFTGAVYGGEAGVEIAGNLLFRGIQSEYKHRFHASVGYTGSFNRFEYVNVKYMKDHDHAAMTGGSTETEPTNDGRDINTTFINVSTNSLHEHKIAELYRTHLRLWSITVGYTFNF